MLLLCLAVVSGVGYAVRKPLPWVREALGIQRCLEIKGKYLRALGGLLPWDSDGDYFPDSVEEYLGGNPKNNLQVPWSFVVNDWEFSRVVNFSQRVPHVPNALMQPGERRLIRARMIFADERLGCDAGMKFQLASVAAVPPEMPQTISLTTERAVEFELTAPTAAKAIGPDTLILLNHPVSGARYGLLTIDIMWRQVAVSCGVEELAGVDETIAKTMTLPTIGRKMSFVRLTWPALPTGAADVLYIEAMPVDSDEGEAGWFPVDVKSAGTGSCVLAYRHRAEARTGKRGGLKFRVVPAKRTRAPGG
jgi:hypothetical protein